MKKPPPDASDHAHLRYLEWVRERLKDWDPREDHFPDCYIPRLDGVNGVDVEQIEVDSDAADDN